LAAVPSRDFIFSMISAPRFDPKKASFSHMDYLR
jgi:hypothetical protein